MVRNLFQSWLSALLLGLAFLPTTLLAAVVPTGNVEPDPAIWNSGTTGYIGRTADGSILVDAGSLLYSGYAYLGYNSSATGTVTVTGTGSLWRSVDGFYVGRNGNGIVQVEAGGQVNSPLCGLGMNAGSTGLATVSGAGSLWTTTDSLTVGSGGSGACNNRVGRPGQQCHWYSGLCRRLLGNGDRDGDRLEVDQYRLALCGQRR